MRILGIDPGLERVGFGVIDREGSRLKPIAHGLIETPRIALPDRLRLIHEGVTALIAEHKPDQLATERLLFSVNKKTAMDVAKGLGVVLLAGAQAGLPWMEMTPPEIKLAVVGNGAAEKKQVQFMVVRLLNLTETPKPDDVADALAIAIAAALRARIN
ncbi:MAG: crossover junction endodeoxyribonuclease RuvC [Fimbriimonadaceae bacterium]|nr:crossover junction endodeoxyribonuclease RuvC [Fimbriimonadaceae bacterium]